MGEDALCSATAFMSGASGRAGAGTDSASPPARGQLLGGSAVAESRRDPDR